MQEASDRAIAPFLERKRGFLLGIISARNLEGNWTFDEEKLCFVPSDEN